MQLYKLSKVVLRVRNNPASFLNGLTTNTLEQSRNAFVNVHGRIVATFDQVKISEDEWWVVVEAAFVDKLLNHLERYIRLSGVRIERLERQVYFDLEGHGEEVRCMSIPQNKGRLLIAEKEMSADVGEEKFKLFRLRHHIPVQGIDYTDEFLLNVDDQEFVSYTKGCFLGQEPISKVHNRSRPTWKLVVRYEDECNTTEREKMTSKTLDPAINRYQGFVFVGRGGE